MAAEIDPRYHVCILAGGSGERFWPMSRARTPKHLLKLVTERTLLEETVRRLEGVVRPENILVLTNQAQAEAARASLPMLDAAQIVAEPAKRDTAPAAALATGLVRARCPDGVLALLSADAVIRNGARFAAQLAEALEWAAGRRWPQSKGTLLTFAMPPTHPSTGFGYLELGDELATADEGSRFVKVKRFVEKPDAKTAEGYVSSGRYAWNGGIFAWSADTFLVETGRQSPELAAFVRDFPKGDPASYLAERFPLLQKTSVDYAVMEKASSVATIIADFDWDDVGTWTALPKHLATDAAGNATRGPVFALDSSGNIAVSNGRVIALCGVKDLVVVETPDALLVCHRDAVQDIKKLQPILPKDVL